MKLQYYEYQNLPIVIIDNYYSEKAYNNILQELNFLQNQLLDPSVEIASYDNEGNSNKKNKSIFLDDVYKDRSISHILTENRKLFSNEMCNILTEKNIFFRYCDILDSDSTLVSYYEDQDYYKPHFDHATISALSWFYNEPRGFTGGDLKIEDSFLIECVKNRIAIFPSILQHSVTTVTNNKKGMGRFTISQFACVNLN